MSAECHFCDESEALDRHHIVPRRHGGSDDEENIVTVCPNCHRKLETLYDSRFYDEVMGTESASIETPVWWNEPVRCEVGMPRDTDRTWTYGAAYKFICRREKEIRSLAGGVGGGERALLCWTFQHVASTYEIGLSKSSAKHIFNELRRHGAIFENPNPMSGGRGKAFKTNRVWYENVTKHTKAWYDEPGAIEATISAMRGSQ